MSNSKISSYDSQDKTKIKYQSEAITPLKEGDSNIQYGGVTSVEDDTPLVEKDGKNQRTCGKVYGILCKLHIEPVMFCYMFAYMMNLTCMSNMMMDKGCLYHLNYSAEVCKNLSDPEYKDEKAKVEVLASNFSLYFKCMSFIGAFFMIFIAPWSDKYSRKIPLLLALFGSILTDVGFIWCTIHFELSNEYLLWSKIPSEICGGFICILTIIYSHASEVSSKQFRTIKYALVEAAFGLAICIGGVTSGILYQYYGYASIYETSAALHVFSFLWVVFIVEETTGLDVNAGWCEKMKDFFVFQKVKEGIKSTFRRRENSQRAIILLLMASMCVIVLSYESFSSIGFVFVHHIYNWNPTTYSFVTSTFSLIQMPLTIIMVPILIRFCKVDDYTFGVIGTVSLILKNIIISFSKYNTFIYYLGNAAGSLIGLSAFAIRSCISKLVGNDELGQVFSFLATCEAVIPIFGTIAVTKIFTATLDITPNIAYLASAVSMLLPLFTFIWAIKLTRNSSATESTSDPVFQKI